MRAAVMRSTDTPFVVEDLGLADPARGQVRVRLAASGVCHSDLSIRNGTIPSPMPVVLGHEGAGVVDAVADDVSSVGVGDHVILSWVTPCRRCRWCLASQPELCEHGFDHAYAGPYATDAQGEGVHPGFGTATFGELTVVPEGAVVRIDPGFPLDLAAIVGCGVVTGVGAIVNAARVTPGESVAVIGCGGVGLAAIQGARLAGAARIVAVDVAPDALGHARRNGATDVVDASTDDPVAAVRDLVAGGVDHGVEVVGRSTTISQAYAMTRRGGTVTIVGAGRFDDMVSFPAMGLMADAKTVRGTVYGSTDPARDFPRAIDLAQRGRLDLEALVTHRIGLDAIETAFDRMGTGAGVRSVVVYG